MAHPSSCTFGLLALGTRVAPYRGKVQTADLLHSVYEYRKLLSREQLLGGRMDATERMRLGDLEHQLSTDSPARPDAPRRRYVRSELHLSAMVKAGGRVHTVEVVNLGGGGLCVAPAPNLRGGERAVVRIVLHESGREYQYPVQAGWVVRGGPKSAMGLPFVGAPLLLKQPEVQ